MGLVTKNSKKITLQMYREGRTKRVRVDGVIDATRAFAVKKSLGPKLQEGKENKNA